MAPMRILIIEDDREAAAYLVKAFREAGHLPDHAGDGLEGYGMASEGAYDVLIVDRMLPKLDGLSLIGGLREQKIETPVLILSALTVSTLLWADLRNGYVWAVLFLTLGYGAIGFVDDYIKLSKADFRGLSGRGKLVLQAGLGIAASVWIAYLTKGSLGTGLALPVFKELLVPLGFAFPVFGMFVMLGASNAVNLTDGLDGLAIVPTIIAAGVFALIAYLVGNRVFADYLQLHPVAGVGELSVFCSALIGAGLGFLWFNAPPAAVFMGDTGSLALGGALGAVAVAVKHEIVLFIVGGLFVVETVSVIIQVFWYKRTGRRVFLMAPLHHHFEKKGWSEPTIVIRFWIIAMILALVGLGTLKIR